GLQNRTAGGKAVRGGFDSHLLPPEYDIAPQTSSTSTFRRFFALPCSGNLAGGRPIQWVEPAVYTAMGAGHGIVEWTLTSWRHEYRHCGSMYKTPLTRFEGQPFYHER